LGPLFILARPERWLAACAETEDSVLPEPPEPIWCHIRVAHGVTYILVVQVMLTAPESSWGDVWAL